MITPAAASESGRTSRSHDRNYLIADRRGVCFALRLDEAREVGRLPDGGASVSGSKAAMLLLHGHSVPVLDPIRLLGEPEEQPTGEASRPRYFVASRVEPSVCVGLDDLEGIRSGSEEVSEGGLSASVEGYLEVGGRSIPVLGLAALGRRIASSAEGAHGAE